jgi:hypothetical protein
MLNAATAVPTAASNICRVNFVLPWITDQYYMDDPEIAKTKLSPRWTMLCKFDKSSWGEVTSRILRAPQFRREKVKTRSESLFKGGGHPDDPPRRAKSLSMSEALVLGWRLHLINNEDIDRSFIGFEVQSELVLQDRK